MIHGPRGWPLELLKGPEKLVFMSAGPEVQLPFGVAFNFEDAKDT